ncbi:MAG: HlyC/CorC family transporter [Lawsonibacter sp.]|nr:HlyC/CorC family transporter [Lawsonibacter sp.]
MDRKPLKEVISVPEGQLWLILFFVSLSINAVQLLWRPILNLLHRKHEVSEDNIMAMVEEGEESGTIQSNEKEFIENVFEFDNTTAKDVMVHRTDMVTLPLDAEEGAILEIIRQSGLSRFPVYGEDIDDIVGVLSTREYLLNFQEADPKPLKELLRPAYFVPETVAADVLFRDMQGKKTHLALVVDEYGGTSGLVTLEDLLEELVGNIYDEFDPQEEQEIIALDDGRWRVSGSADLEELAEAMGFELPEDEERDYDTLGGLVFSQLSVIPEDGSRPAVDALGLHIQVEELCDRRVEWALVERLGSELEKETE